MKNKSYFQLRWLGCHWNLTWMLAWSLFVLQNMCVTFWKLGLKLFSSWAGHQKAHYYRLVLGWPKTSKVILISSNFLLKYQMNTSETSLIWIEFFNFKNVSCNLSEILDSLSSFVFLTWDFTHFIETLVCLFF